MFKFEDIKSGMIVTTADKEVGIVVGNLVVFQDSYFVLTESDLSDTRNSYDIIKICEFDDTYAGFTFRDIKYIDEDNLIVLFDRSEEYFKNNK